MDAMMIALDREATEPLYEQLYTAIKREILEGKISMGDRLPSRRKLAEHLSVSRTTIEFAYDQLVAEGYIESLPRKGYFVKDIEELALTESTGPFLKNTNAPAGLEEFSPGKVDADSFPFSMWRKILKDVLDKNNTQLLEPGHPQGDPLLRNEIAGYLYQSRGVNCSPEQVIVGSGTEQLLPLLIRLIGPSAIFAFEDPGYPLTHTVFTHNDRRAIPVSVDSEGLLVEELIATDADVAYVTPSHQFPTGAVMSAARRTQLLKWAAAGENRYIIEDDYDSEFRYIGRPIPSLQNMDSHNRVIYISTFSKSLMPSLRIAYMVLPAPLMEDYWKTFLHYSSSVPRTDQQLVTRFMENGHFMRHLNKMRIIYRKKWEVLTDTLQNYHPYVSVSGDQAGMHLVLNVKTGAPEKELIAQAAEAGIRVSGLAAFHVKQSANESAKIVIGFGGLPESEIPSRIDRLMASWSIKKQASRK
ncbi:PLP-dependent aminotransferase family protein [Indiicoccus explosivorum]|uniref:MocR-like pyridoxine biosynthesis transcription factor PdxR n=1 Tax=Indiicoccus explosivorum TaxID=1917864 RepID=UPI000B449FDB|nr:PLP-dependent aminotransferase family protein [Indiicoccus explosivorum]